MIKLIVGLGNPGRQYELTRHNAGFLFLDVLADEYANGWQHDSKFNGMVATAKIAHHSVVLLKPDTFMNRSGLAVGKVARYYKLQPEDILVVHDELDFEAGVVKLKKDGGHAGHNGLRDIIAHLNSNQFYRLRLGIGRPPTGKVVADYVLSAPSKTEFEHLLVAFQLCKQHVPKMVSGDITNVMNLLNSSKK